MASTTAEQFQHGGPTGATLLHLCTTVEQSHLELTESEQCILSIYSSPSIIYLFIFVSCDKYSKNRTKLCCLFAHCHSGSSRIFRTIWPSFGGLPLWVRLIGKWRRHKTHETDGLCWRISLSLSVVIHTRSWCSVCCICSCLAHHCSQIFNRQQVIEFKKIIAIVRFLFFGNSIPANPCNILQKKILTSLQAT